MNVLNQTAHLVGICGAGMKALAELLHERGWVLSGSDLAAPGASLGRLMAMGLSFHQGHAAAHLPADADCLIYSPAIPEQNVERQEAARRGVPQWSYNQMIGRLMAERSGLCIAGTHGKSTTTAMVGWILRHSGHDPSVIVGAESRDDQRSGWSGTGEWFVAESCEFQQSFLDYSPRHAIILSVEQDHFDCFSDLASMTSAFHQFALRVPSDGVIVVNGSCAAAMAAVHDTVARIVTFGVQEDANNGDDSAGHRRLDWVATNVQTSEAGTRFEIRHRSQSWSDLTLLLWGRHNAENALAAAALCAEIGLTPEDIVRALRTFPGIRRRLESVSNANGILRIDDYAHHPTAIRATLRTVRDVFRKRRIVCCFQPHQVSRTVGLMDEFARSFGAADKVLIVPVFAARESVTDEPQLVASELARRITLSGVSCRFVESLDQLPATLDDAVRPGDVCLMMGAGDIDRIHDLLRGQG